MNIKILLKNLIEIDFKNNTKPSKKKEKRQNVRMKLAD